MKHLLVTAIIALLVPLGKKTLGQPTYDPGRQFTPTALQEDLTVLRTVLESIHIGLYRYADKTQIDFLFSRAFTACRKPLTELEFLKVVTPIIVAIRDEHTAVLPSAEFWKTMIGQTGYANDPSNSKWKLFPFFVKVIDNRLYVDNNLSNDTAIRRGEEILSINGTSSQEVLHQLLATVPTNGYIETFRMRHLEQFSLNQTYNRFMVHYALYVDTPATFRLILRRNNQETKEKEIESLYPAQIFNHYWRRYSTVNDRKKRNENPLEAAILPGGIGYLRLSDFHTPTWSKYRYSYSTEYSVFFEKLGKEWTKHLIVDLRGNEGGNAAIAINLLPYLCTTTFRPYDFHEVLRYRFDSLRQYFRDPESLPALPEALFSPSGSRTFRSNSQYKTETWSRPMQPSVHHFRGKIYVLTNGATGSAAAILATIIRVNRPDAIFVGEECGGDMEGPISGSGTDILLPNTHLRVDIPFIKRWINLNGYLASKGRGIIPDYVVTLNASDIPDNVDTEMNFVLQLINMSQ